MPYFTKILVHEILTTLTVIRLKHWYFGWAFRVEGDSHIDTFKQIKAIGQCHIMPKCLCVYVCVCACVWGHSRIYRQKKCFFFHKIQYCKMWYTTMSYDENAYHSWWPHQMETISELLAICAGNSPVTGEFASQRPVTRSFDVFFDLRLNKRLSKQSWGWWLETPSPSLWSHCNVLTYRQSIQFI